MHDASTNRRLAAGTSTSETALNDSLADFVPRPGVDFVATAAINELTSRALAYLEIGYAVHLSGPAGTGKTTLALHIASQIGRRCTLLHGDDELRGSDLLGKDAGYRRQSIRDNYVSSILKTEETVSLMWKNNRLTTASEQGHTVIYDEFTRSPAAANNAFLSILEEGILNIPTSGQDKNYVRVHSDFRAIFTSNPEEYVGVHKSQDALLDRMITLEVSHQDRETEISILHAKSGRTAVEVAAIVDVIRGMRQKLGEKNGPTIRAALAIAKILDHRNAAVSCDDAVFMNTCQDVLFYNATRQSNRTFIRADLESVVRGVVLAMPKKKESVLNVIANQLVTENHEMENSAGELVFSGLDKAVEGISQLTGTRLADSALGAKNDPSRLVSENKAGEVSSTDKLRDSEFTLDSASRRLPRPPAFESTGIPTGAAVTSK